MMANTVLVHRHNTDNIQNKLLDLPLNLPLLPHGLNKYEVVIESE